MTETDDARRAIREIVEDLVAAWNRPGAAGAAQSARHAGGRGLVDRRVAQHGPAPGRAGAEAGGAHSWDSKAVTAARFSNSSRTSRIAALLRHAPGSRSLSFAVVTSLAPAASAAAASAAASAAV